MYYIDFLPFDIITIIITKLNSDELKEFVSIFPEYKNLNYLYITFLYYEYNYF